MARVKAKPEESRIGIKLSLHDRVTGTPVFTKNYDSFPIVFGRSTECHVPLPQQNYLSRSHGCILIENGKLTVMDLNSRNGIQVGKERVLRHSFEGNGSFRVGPLEFNLEKINLEPELELAELSRVTAINIQPATGKVAVAPRTTKKIPVISETPPPKKMEAAAIPMPAAPKTRKLNVAPPPVDSIDGEHVIPMTSMKSIRPFGQLDPKPGPGLRAVLFWRDEVFDVRQYLPGDRITIGNHYSDPLYLPTLPALTDLGFVNDDQTATLTLPKAAKWEAQTAKPENVRALPSASAQSIQLRTGALFNLSLGHGVVIQLSFAEVTRPFLRRSWIENKEEFKNAIKISSAIHVLICLLAIIGKPKQEAPKVENVPPRFAKLLVNPPKQIFVPPPPPPPPPEEKKPEPPPEPVKMEKPLKKMMVAKKKVQKIEKPQKQQAAPPKEQPVAPPPPSEADQLMSALNDFSANTPPSKVDLSKVKVESTQVSTFTTGNMMNTLKSKSGKLAPSGSPAPMSSGVKTNFKGVAGNAGAREVKGQVVGRPEFGGARGPQGLTDKEVRAALNKHLGAIQQCYERSLLDNASLAGRVQYEWHISPSGSVTDARVKKSEVSGGDGLNECVIGVIRGISFPAAKNGQPTIVDIGFPFGRS